MRSWTASALGAMTVLLACSRHDDLANLAPESAPEYWAPLRTLPWLADFRLGAAPAQGNRIAPLADEFKSGEPIYLSMRINDAPRGTVVTLHWYGPGNRNLGSQTRAVPSDRKRMRFMQSNTLEWPEGAYRAETWIGDYKLNEQHFHIVSENVGRDR